jgi:hypothetical protein
MVTKKKMTFLPQISALVMLMEMLYQHNVALFSN